VRLNRWPLFGARLNRRPLFGAWLNRRPLFGAWLNRRPLFGAWLNRRPLFGAWLRSWTSLGAIFDSGLVWRQRIIASFRTLVRHGALSGAGIRLRLRARLNRGRRQVDGNSRQRSGLTYSRYARCWGSIGGGKRGRSGQYLGTAVVD
jgi:hypothetical protein